MTAAAWSLVEELWARLGIDDRYGEEVTIGEHMLQTAACAADDGADAELVVAALLHDVGHLVASADGDDRDRHHDRRGHRVLAAVLPAAVAEPVRLHVAAKRYLVATDPRYRGRLSPASIHTLALQGGAMTEIEQRAFLAEPQHEAAVRLRRYDDEGKVPGRAVPALGHYRATIEALPPC